MVAGAPIHLVDDGGTHHLTVRMAAAAAPPPRAIEEARVPA